jgi:hypothetical protein
VWQAEAMPILASEMPEKIPKTAKLVFSAYAFSTVQIPPGIPIQQLL